MAKTVKEGEAMAASAGSSQRPKREASSGKKSEN
jgi:hypothetical protein